VNNIKTSGNGHHASYNNQNVGCYVMCFFTFFTWHFLRTLHHFFTVRNFTLFTRFPFYVLCILPSATDAALVHSPIRCQNILHCWQYVRCCVSLSMYQQLTCLTAGTKPCLLFV